jgi:hypothetical protein
LGQVLTGIARVVALIVTPIIRQSEAIQEKEAKRRAAAADAQDFSFAPVVNENSMILASAIDRANESFMDRVERLSFNDNLRQQQLRKGLAEEYALPIARALQQLTFSRQILLAVYLPASDQQSFPRSWTLQQVCACMNAPGCVTLTLRASVDELHDNPQGRAQKQHIQRLKEAAEKQVRPLLPTSQPKTRFVYFS